MDALKKLQEEMARKRKERDEAVSAAGNIAGRKWVKRGELEQQREIKYHETEAAEHEERAKKALAPQHRLAAAAAEEAAAAAKAAPVGTAASSKGAGGSAASSKGAGTSTEALKPTEVMRRLRSLGQPIKLFGEGDEERLERYRAISTAMPTDAEVNMELLKGQTWGQSERQLFDDSGNAKHVAAQGLTANEDADDEPEGIVASCSEEIISRHFKGLMKVRRRPSGASNPRQSPLLSPPGEHRGVC